jgi:hypothetical protein
LAKWSNHFSQLLNIYGVRQTEIHTAEPIVPEPSAFEFEMAFEKLKGHKSPGTDHIPVEWLKQWIEQIAFRSINFINSIWNKEEFPEEWGESIIVPIYKKGGKTDCSNYRGISILSIMHKILSNILLSSFTSYA